MIRTLAIDDEPLALKLVTGYIRQTPFLTFTGGFENPLAAMDFLRDQPVDLICLDIQIPDMPGTDFVRNLDPRPKVIFTTAHEKYALEGFRLDALGYLLKPFSYEEFLAAAQKARKQIEMENRPATAIEANESFLFLKSEYKIRRINFNEILYIEGMKDYVKVFLKNEPRPILSINSLKTLESKLPESKFMRVHRSFIINLDQIDTIERNRIVFGKIYIPISDPYREKFQKFLNENFL